MGTILPSDILLLTIDYLDSPSMMECRQVCKSWLDVVDQNRLLWNSFHIPKEGKEFKLGMLELFTSRSVTRLVSFSTKQRLGNPEITEDMSKSKKSTARKKASKFVSKVEEALLKSSSTLVSFSSPDEDLSSQILAALYSSSKLKTFHHFFPGDDATEIIKVKVRASLQSLSKEEELSGSKPGLTVLILGRCEVMGLKNNPILESTCSNLVHLQVAMRELPDNFMAFPSLKILELTRYDKKSVISNKFSFPVLKVLTIAGSKDFRIPDNLSSTLEMVWLLGGMRYYDQGDALQGIVESSLLVTGSNSFLEHYPKLKSFRIDSTVNFNERGLIKMLEARKENVQTGFEVGGMKMLAIEKLTLDVGKIKDAKNLNQLKGLVELVDSRDAPSSITID